MLLQVSVLIIQHHLHWYFSITITIDHFDRHHYYQFHLNHHFYHLHPYSSIGLIAREVKSAHSRNIHCICLPKPSRHVAIDIGMVLMMMIMMMILRMIIKIILYYKSPVAIYLKHGEISHDIVSLLLT